jgi:integrase
MIVENPFSGLKMLETKSSAHKAYQPDEIKKIKEYCLEHDPNLWLVINFIHFALIRSTEELRHLKIIDIKEQTIIIQSSSSKNSKTQHIMIPPPLQAIIDEYHLRDYHPDHYVFAANGPSETKVDKNHWYRRHVKALEATQLTGKKHDLYAWKHTGVIALWKETQDIEIVRFQCRHSDVSTTQVYLRDLGQGYDYTKINNIKAI